MSDPRENFVLKQSQWKPTNRIIMNARRASFDVAPPTLSYDEYSERLLRQAVALDPDPRERDQLVTFLDDTSALKHIRLASVDLGKPEGLCFFINIYHTLLQHGRLILGQPTSQNWALFFGR